MPRKKQVAPQRRDSEAKKAKPSKGVDLMSELAMNVALWTASGTAQGQNAPFLHQLSVEMADEPMPMDFTHVCKDTEELYSFSFLFLKTIIEDSKVKVPKQKLHEGILEVNLDDTVVIRMNFISIS